MAIGIDVGTSFCVSARKDENDDTIVRSERDCFIGVSVDFEDMINNSGYKYVRGEENGEERLYIVGEDAIKLANLTSSKDMSGERKTGLRRPMAKMVINSSMDKRAIVMLKHIIQGLAGKPQKKGEVCVMGIPANPLDESFNNVFHSSMCQGFIKELGYDVYPINEALAIVYATNPTTKSAEGEDLPMTGISMSFGGGGVNACLAYRGVDTIRFSFPRSGDWIDEQTASICSLTSSEVSIFKEKASRSGELDLSNPDYTNEVIAGLCIYYRNLIMSVVTQFKEQFLKEGTQFSDPIEVVLSGGTSLPNGFEKLVEEIINEVTWPFDIKGVRRAQDPLSATAVGCLTAAISKEKKKK